MADEDLNDVEAAEAALAQEEGAGTPVDDAPADEAAQAQEAAKAAEDEARALGWKPKEEWRGDTTYWVDAEQFVERQRSAPARLAELERRLEDQAREQTQQLEAQRAIHQRNTERLVKDAEARMAQAKADMDMDAYEAARDARDEARAEPEAPKPPEGPQHPPETQAWLNDRPAVRDDREMMAWARHYASEAAMLGKASVVDQLAHADAKLKEAFPEKMGVQRPAPTPPAAQVEGGLVQPRRGKAGKGWNDIPAGERSFLEEEIERKTWKTRDEAAKAYFAEVGGA